MSESQAVPSNASHQSERCFLFVYGQLQPGIRAPRTMHRSWPDRVRGKLFCLGQYPAAVQLGQGSSWIRGHVLEIDEQELTSDLDPYEGIDEGLYRRIRTVTEKGTQVWIYEYASPLPRHATGPMEQWPAEKT